MLYSHNGEYPKSLPERIRLSSGLTRTDSSTFTEEEIADAGYVSVGDPPSFDGDTQKVIWNGTAWEVVELTTEEINAIAAKLWEEVRESRDTKIEEVEWRVFRYQSEERAGITTHVDNISDLDTYMQELRDIPETYSNARDVEWPSFPLTIEQSHANDD